MLLVLDVGNTQVVLGVYDGDTLVHRWRMATDHKRTADEYWATFSNLFFQADLVPDRFTGVCISSVVPPLDLALEDIADRYLPVPPVWVKPGVKTGLVIRSDNPHEVGADRIVNAVAALELYEGPMVVVDFGTATTLDALSADSEYLGGAIVPGIAISAEALFQHAAKLPRVDLHVPPAAIGRNTVDCLRSGLILGYAALIDGMVARFQREMDADSLTVIATGGLAPVLASQAARIQHVEPELTLIGLKLIYDRNQGGDGREGRRR